MNHFIVSQGRAHTWTWLLQRSRAVPVERLKSQGFGAIAIVPYSFEQNGRKVSGDKIKKVAINCGSMVRIIPYSDDWKEAPDLTRTHI